MSRTMFSIVDGGDLVLTFEEWVNNNLFNFVECKHSDLARIDLAYQVYTSCGGWDEEEIKTTFDNVVKIIPIKDAGIMFSGRLLVDEIEIYPKYIDKL